MNIKIISSFGDGNTQAISTIKEISEVDEDEQINFDFTSFWENNSFNNLLIASAINDYKNHHPNTVITCTPKSNNDYLSHIGFYDMFGFDYGREKLWL